MSTAAQGLYADLLENNDGFFDMPDVVREDLLDNYLLLSEYLSKVLGYNVMGDNERG